MNVEILGVVDDVDDLALPHRLLENFRTASLFTNESAVTLLSHFDFRPMCVNDEN